MKRLPAILLCLLVVGFVTALVHLLHVRFARGDIYPAGSTLRADPLGARAFHDALARVTHVRRQVQPLDTLGDGREATLFFISAAFRDTHVPAADFQHLRQFAADGGRIVIALQPEARTSLGKLLHDLEDLDSDAPRSKPSRAPKTNQPPAKPFKPKPAEEREPTSQVRLGDEWGFSLREPTGDDTPTDVPKLIVRRKEGAGLPLMLNWHGREWFETSNRAWRTLYTNPEGGAVAIERPLGAGTLVLLTDSWHFTNEALRDDRTAEWLAWLVGRSRRVIFDETHLGIREQPGVAMLARRYRLHGVVAVLAVLAGLFVWRNSTSFPPVEPTPRQPGDNAAVQGREAAAGFVSLLRRNLPVASLASTCFQEWRKSCARATPPARLQAADDAFATIGRHTTTGGAVTSFYQQLSTILNRTSSKP